jgi:hypothetical protein
MKKLMKCLLFTLILVGAYSFVDPANCEEFNLKCPQDAKQLITEDMTPAEKAYADSLSRYDSYSSLIDYEKRHQKEISDIEERMVRYKDDKASMASLNEDLNVEKDKYKTGMKIVPKLRDLKKKCFLDILDQQKEIDMDDQEKDALKEYSAFIDHTYAKAKTDPEEKAIYDKYITKFTGDKVKKILEDAENDMAIEFYEDANRIAKKKLTNAKAKTPKKYSEQTKQDFLDACMGSYHYMGFLQEQFQVNASPLTKEYEPVCKRLYKKMAYYKEVDLDKYVPYLKTRLIASSDPELRKGKTPNSLGFVGVGLSELLSSGKKDRLLVRDFVKADRDKLVYYQKMHLIFLNERIKDYKENGNKI